MSDPTRSSASRADTSLSQGFPPSLVRAAHASIVSGPPVQVVEMAPRTVIVESDVRFAPGAAVALTITVGAITCTTQGRIARVDARNDGEKPIYRARIALRADLPPFEAPDSDEVITMVPEPSAGQAGSTPSTLDQERARREELEKTVQKLKAAMKTAEEFLTQVGQQHDSERAKWDEERAELEKRVRDAEQRDEAIAEQMASAAERAGQLMQQAEDLRTELTETQEREKELAARVAEAETAWKAEREALDARIAASAKDGEKQSEALMGELETAKAREAKLAAETREAEAAWAKERRMLSDKLAQAEQTAASLQDRIKQSETDEALLETRVKQAETDAATLNDALKEVEATASSLQQKLQQAEQATAAAQEQVKKADARVESLAREFATAKEQAAAADKQAQELTKELKGAKDQTAKAEQRIQELSRDLKAASEQGTKAEKRADELARELKVAKDVAAKAEHRADEIGREVKVLKDQAVAARKDADGATHELDIIRKEHEKLAARQRDEEAAWQKERESLQHRLQEAEELAGVLHDRLTEADRTLQEQTALAEELEATRADLAQAQQTILAHGQELLEWVAQREELTIKLQANEARLSEQQKLLDRIRQQVSGA